MNALLASPTAEMVVKVREQLGKTQEQAASILGMSSRRWSDWETGAREMPACKWTLFLLLSEMHPGFTLLARRPHGRTSAAR